MPPFTRGMVICSYLESFGISLLGIVEVLMFVFVGLIGLALASFATWTVSLILGYFFIMKPSMEIRKKHSTEP